MKIFSPILKGTTTVSQGTTNLSGSFTGSLLGTAATASYADNFTVGGTLTAQTINVQIITSSIEFNTGSTRNGSTIANTHQFTGSVLMSGSVGIGTNPPGNFNAVTFTGPFFDVAGIMQIKGTSANTVAILQFGGDTYRKATIASSIGTEDPYLAFGTASSGSSSSSSERMRIDSAGNIGIGTSTVASSAGWTPTLVLNATSAALIIKGINGQENSLGTSNGFYVDCLGNSTASNNNIIFRTSNTNSNFSATERMRITSGGSLLMAKDAAIGINTSDGADNGYLALCGASADGENRGGYIYLSGNERVSDPGMVVIGAGNVIGIGSVIAFRTGAGVERMRLIGNGRLLIGTTTDGGYLLYVNGNAAGTSGFANVSDSRFKKDITPIENALTKINQLNGISFNWDKDSRPDLNLDDKNHLGLIAQDVETILPQVVSTGEDEQQTKTITYSDIVPVLIEAIKELSAKNTSLEERLTALENN
jgi:hypothetical protein